MSTDERPIRVALPRGDLREPLAERLRAAGFVVEGYGEGSRAYRFEVEGRPGVVVRVFSDRDIPIQVALGQYDLGIASRAWIDELLTRHRLESIVPLRALDIGAQRIVVAGEQGASLERLAGRGPLRVATEYGNIAQHYLNRARLPDYRSTSCGAMPTPGHPTTPMSRSFRTTCSKASSSPNWRRCTRAAPG